MKRFEVIFAKREQKGVENHYANGFLRMGFRGIENHYKPCGKLMMPGSFWRNGSQNSQKTISIFTVPRWHFALLQNTKKPLVKHCFATAGNHIQNTL